MPAKPVRYGPRAEMGRIELDDEAIRRAGEKVSFGSVRPQTIATLREFHHYRVEGAEHVPGTAPAVYVENLCYVPLQVGEMTLSEHSVMTLESLSHRVDHPLLVLAHPNFFANPVLARRRRESFELLGFFPGTMDNARRVLASGYSVFIAPEARDSIPPYRLRPFYWGFARLAWEAGVPIVPMAFTGPHEAVFRIIRDGRAVYLNRGRRNAVPYLLQILPPIDPRSHLASLDDDAAVSRFCDEVRARIQAAVDRETLGRPLVERARELHERQSDPIERGSSRM